MDVEGLAPSASELQAPRDNYFHHYAQTSNGGSCTPTQTVTGFDASFTPVGLVIKVRCLCIKMFTVSIRFRDVTRLQERIFFLLCLCFHIEATRRAIRDRLSFL